MRKHHYDINAERLKKQTHTKKTRQQHYPYKVKRKCSLRKIFAIHITNAILVIILLLETQRVHKESAKGCGTL